VRGGKREREREGENEQLKCRSNDALVLVVCRSRASYGMVACASSWKRGLSPPTLG
jgi:hypothetical protein